MGLLQSHDPCGDEVERAVPTHRAQADHPRPQERAEHALRVIEQRRRGEAFDTHLAAG